MEHTKELLVFLNQDDELEMWSALKGAVPGLLLVDGSRWSTQAPPTREDPGVCQSPSLFLWDPHLAPTLPCRARGGMYDGPRSGLVIEWLRCIELDGELRSGRFAAGFDNSREAGMGKFADTAFKVVRSRTKASLRRADGTLERIYRAGAGAERQAVEGLSLRDRSVSVYFEATPH